MLLPKRDLYNHDYTVKFYPKVNNNQFYKDMMKNEQLLNYYVFKNEFFKQHVELQKYRDYGLIGSVGVSLIAIYFYKNLPLISRIQGKWTSFLMKLMIFGLPYATVYIVTDELKEKQMWDQYTKNFKNYVYYKQTGDIRCFKVQIESTV
ncbi:unnamed protein product (macronuclear) [Paramecium tetraurelia]|uniref:Transmembrane protein n=1 Tax=Paramecium tetraurelia TaxID=5888 RepID=A0CBZ2_PARTE|nr:uncharacterized protein GSPATT00037093001 [Paramecium tetraurelia]CAK68309.1 unnamed protein product [Paramecium tetraurelia]|eukprot:XP_001435706.1 hypothetical protein (macronuclear) [Paramecium tetraurelia strain d4-2]